MTRIYTRTGDSGETGLMKNVRVKKNDARVEAAGTLDELNAHLGLVLSCKKNELLTQIQRDLFELGSIVAGGNCICEKEPCNLIIRVAKMETEMDRIEKLSPPLKNFILPGGTLIASQLHIARTVCRRAERTLVNIANINLITYLNRLSDLLFMLARLDTVEQNIPETIWKI